jgi:hypothetical protein
MKLPHKFQMRVKDYPGYTHHVEMNAWGDYEVKWARGFVHEVGYLPQRVVASEYAENYADIGAWIVVEDKPKQEEASLPDEFYFLNSVGEHFKAQRQQFYWVLTSQEDGRTVSVTEYRVKSSLKTSWKIIDKKPLTAEQQRTLKDFNEQFAQLSQSIKLNEQDVAHKMMLISSYKARQDELLDKIAEINGEELPSITKAKRIRAELDKLKGKA